MPEKVTLYKEIESIKNTLNLMTENKIVVPSYISENLKYSFFDWQREALENLICYNNKREKENIISAEHLMFNMATGTGKTLLMASLILYYYKKGYRNFIFFVNQNNIVSKTESNFLDKYHSKYLFNNKIVIDEKEVKIKKVNTFSQINDGSIEIKFTTIQQLYNDIHKERENQTTLEELTDRDIIMFADEAHHLSSATKSGQLKYELEEITEKTKAEDVEEFGWERTVINLILNKKGKKLIQNKNVLLEFTATIDSNSAVQEKYFNKIIYKFDLKDFLQRGYTKEINLISSTFDKKEIILHCLLLNWYRHFVAIKNNIPNFKPVILFRSKTIEESKNDYEEFFEIINNLSLKDFDFLKDINKKIVSSASNSIYEQGKARTQKVLDILDNNFSEVYKYIKENFQERNIIITNSKTNTTKTKEKTDNNTEKLLNNLEDKDNHIRAIFTVERLTEGWDVLNLFDIVRLYRGQNSGGSSKKEPEATTKEKQLIGRGVRYFPFNYNEREKNRRKFDQDLEHELRVLEELYFYTHDEESRYISELKKALVEAGYMEKENTKIKKEFKLKEDFKRTTFYNNVQIIGNNLIENKVTAKMTLQDIPKNFFEEYHVNSNKISEDSDFMLSKKGTHYETKDSEGLETKTIKEFEKHIFDKALNLKINSEPHIFNFEKLKKKLKIKSYDDLYSEEFLGDFKIPLIHKFKDFDSIPNKEKLNILTKFLSEIFIKLDEKHSDYIGGEFSKYSSFKEIFGEPKTKIVDGANCEASKRLEEKLKDEEWYVLDSFVGTSEERALIEFVSLAMNKFKEKYNDFYILRNEEVYKIYDFETGKGFQPDFLMFLKEKGERNFYQIFIEPKGKHLLENDAWKENFLKEITHRYKNKNVYKYETDSYYLIGLPFYTKADKSQSEEFNIEFEKLLNN